MKDYIEERAVEIAYYIIENKVIQTLGGLGIEIDITVEIQLTYFLQMLLGSQIPLASITI